MASAGLLEIGAGSQGGWLKDPKYVRANIVLLVGGPEAYEVPGFVLTHWWVKLFLGLVLAGLQAPESGEPAAGWCGAWGCRLRHLLCLRARVSLLLGELQPAWQAMGLQWSWGKCLHAGGQAGAQCVLGLVPAHCSVRPIPGLWLGC